MTAKLSPWAWVARTARPRNPLARPAAAERQVRTAAPARVFAPQLLVSEKPAAAVLRVIRRGGLVLRDEIVRETQLSAATVNRQVTALIEEVLEGYGAEMSRIAARSEVPF